MIEDRPEACSLFRHCLRASLTKSDSVPLAGSFQKHLPVVIARRKVIAGHGVPTESPVNRQTAGFALAKQSSGLPL